MGKLTEHPGIYSVRTRWRAMIGRGRGESKLHVGYYDTLEEAIEARHLKCVELGLAYEVVDLDGEIWKPSPSLGDDYMVSNKGRIKSLNFNKGTYSKIMKPTPSRNSNYLCVIMNSERSYPIHRLVMEAFCGASDLHVNHKDFNTFNNCLDNLEYVTQRENCSHAIGGAKGCSFIKGKWVSAIEIDRKKHTLGFFDTYEEAHQRYIDALREYGLQNKYVA